MTHGFNDDKSKVEVYSKDEVYRKDEVYPKSRIISVSGSVTAPGDFSQKEAQILLPADTDLEKVLVLSVEQRVGKKPEGESQMLYSWVGMGGMVYNSYEDGNIYTTAVYPYPYYYLHPSVQSRPAIVLVLRNDKSIQASILYRCKYMILD